MLLNLSNHPFANWPPEQQAAAMAGYGHVQDLDFPVVEPMATTDQITMLAEQYFSKIKAIDPIAVHLMGELTFCYQLTILLKVSGYSVVASTTHRAVSYDADGNKKSTFSFVQFREY